MLAKPFVIRLVSRLPPCPFQLGYFFPAPLMYFVLLWQHREALQDQGILDREAATGNPALGHLKFLFDAHKPKFYYRKALFQLIEFWEAFSVSRHAMRSILLPFYQAIECLRLLSLASLIGIDAEDSAVSPTLGMPI